jgi:diketogulonate reductase-like aldo/keto reductase
MMDRGEFLRLFAFGLASASLGRKVRGQSSRAGMHARAIPATGERIPVIGCGTWRGFDVRAGRRQGLREVLQVLFDAGGTVIDSSPMYGAAEAAVGTLLADMNARDRAFLATKIWTRGRASGERQMLRSFERLQDDVIDLMQIHNLVDWRTQIATLREWKAQGRIRYLGVTHYAASAHDELEAVMLAEPLDFVQLNYAIDDRNAEARLLRLATERGIAVIVNRPFGGGGLLQRLGARVLPPVAAELGCRSWAQLLLKFILAHPAVTCIIPGTGNPTHMRDNAGAGDGPIPSAEQRGRILAEI